MRAVFLLLPALALAGCGGNASTNVASAENAVAENAASFTPETRGWDDLFERPAAQALDLFARLSLRPGPYAVSGDAYASNGDPIPLTDASTGAANTLTFSARGTAQSLTAASFDIRINDTSQVQPSRDRAMSSIENMFSLAGLDGAAAVKAALYDPKPATGRVIGADYVVTREPVSGEVTRVTVTFTPKSAT